MKKTCVYIIIYMIYILYYNIHIIHIYIYSIYIYIYIQGERRICKPWPSERQNFYGVWKDDQTGSWMTFKDKKLCFSGLPNIYRLPYLYLSIY
jgi:hypothetical protein